ncbi:MAG: hypothetical protein KY469_10585 [Actinobacteria bacterium]|nr:hypothetical protein [Actinomycetota bacterium]
METLTELMAEGSRLSGLLDAGLDVLRASARECAEAYRKAKSQAWLRAPEGTVPERQAWVDAQVADERDARDLAEGMRQAALESVRSRRQQVSLLQTVANAHRAEAEFVAKAPETRTGVAA